MTHESPIQTAWSDLGGVYRRIDDLLALPPQLAQGVAAHVSAWSIEHHLAHLALANELVARNLRSLLKGAGPFVVEGGEAHPEALAVLASGRFPRGRAQAPRMVRPPEKVERAYLVDWLDGNRRDFAELRQRSTELEACTQKVPHQIMGPLSAAQWVRFAAAHSAHHVEIANEIRAALE